MRCSQGTVRHLGVEAGGCADTLLCFRRRHPLWAAANTAVLPLSACPSPDDAVMYGAGPANLSTAGRTGVVTQVWPDGAIDTIQGTPANGTPIFGFTAP